MQISEILIAGFGGQGVLFAGKFLANLGLIAEKNVSWLPSYGPEMRGGTANCSVIISDAPVGSPIVSNPDMLVALNLPSLKRYEKSVKSGGIIILDETLIEERVERQDVKVYYIPATQAAREQGFGSLSNMILMGKALSVIDSLKLDRAAEALKRVIPARKAQLFDVNLKAVEFGYSFG